jgi:hypothetical protein
MALKEGGQGAGQAPKPRGDGVLQASKSSPQLMQQLAFPPPSGGQSTEPLQAICASPSFFFINDLSQNAKKLR